jgi:DNA-binding response OmpR family regulator
MNLLIIEDEKPLAKEMETFLSREGYTCKVVHTGREASEELFVNTYDFILLDLGLPDYEGLNLLREAKENGSEAAFIIITARNTTDDKVTGLNTGADDYLSKPFSLLELASRIKAITRRKHGLQKNEIKIKEFCMDIQNRSVKYNGQLVNLTRKEFDLLHYLVLHKNKVLTRMQLTEHIWGDVIEEDYDSNYIDVHIKNLRKKLSAFAETDWLSTVRGIGYRVDL